MIATILLTQNLAMTDYFTHPLNPPPQGRGKLFDLPSAREGEKVAESATISSLRGARSEASATKQSKILRFAESNKQNGENLADSAN
ncbi:hypothetical protein ACWIUD_05035 [Helicobacter sp. 23-1044]